MHRSLCHGLLALWLTGCGIPETERPPRAARPPIATSASHTAAAVGTRRAAIASVAPAAPPPPELAATPADLHVASDAERARYPFVPAGAKIRTLASVASPPAGFERVPVAADPFAAYLRSLPLRPATAAVRAYDGSLLHASGDARIFAVVELDVSPSDLQQCADSVIRLHAEWRWSRGERDAIGYHFVSGAYASFGRYAAGQRPVIDDKRVRWATKAKARSDRRAFRDYLDLVFTYASTISLAREAKKIDRQSLAAGDFLVLPGGPGHAVLVLDVAQDKDGRRVALLGQGYMPAQDFHVLASQQIDRSPWFSLDGDGIDTPFWPVPFPWSSLRRLE